MSNLVIYICPKCKHEKSSRDTEPSCPVCGEKMEQEYCFEPIDTKRKTPSPN